MKLFKKYWGLIVVVLISLIPLASLLHPGIPLTHDGQDHVARIANFYQNLSEGNLIPRWAGNLNWGYGHPILMFLYPLSSYTASFFHFLGFSFSDSTKLVFAASFIFSGIAMYLWVKEFLDREAAVAAAIVYNFAPYRFVDLYVRGAIGEHVAFIFPPLICYLLLKISKADSFNRIYFSLASLSFAGIILAHNAISIMFLPFICLYGIYLIWINRNRKSLIYQFVAILILGFSLSAFFLLPAFSEGKYTLRDIVTEGITTSRFVNFWNLLYSPWNFGQSGEFSVQVGILSWIGVIVGILSLRFFKNDKSKMFLIAMIFIYFIASIIVMLPISYPLWKTISTLQKFQFPWRFLSVSIFAASVLIAFPVFLIPNVKIKLLITTVIIICALGFTYDYWHPKSYLEKNEQFYTGIYPGTTDTGESSPIWSIRFMEHTSSASAEVLAGEAKIKPIKRTSTLHAYEISTPFRTRIRENTLYFPGWRIYIDGKQNQGIQFQDPQSRGLMTYFVPAGKHKVEIIFGDTRLRTISNYISLAALLIIIGILFSTFRSAPKAGKKS